MNVLLHVHPRTASTSLLTYLQNNAPPDSGHLHHCHYLVDKRHKWFAKTGYQYITGHVGKLNYKVITILRDPVACTNSAYWMWTAKHVQHDGGYDYNEAKNFYMDVMQHHSAIHHMAAEVEAFWNIDIFGKPWANPYQIYEGKLLVLKYEFIEVWPQAIEHFLGIPQAELPHLNFSKPKLQLQFSDAYLRGLYRSRHMQKFYSEEEVNAFVTKWGGTPYQRVDGKKYVKVLSKDAIPGHGFEPVRLIMDEAQLDDINIRGQIGIFGPHAKEYNEVDP